MILFTLIKNLKKALNISLIQILFWAAVLNIAFGIAFYYAERNVQEGLTLVDSLWWSMVTMTTVGYGDYYAKTTIGRFLISYPCMLLGIGIIGYLVGVVANQFIEWAARKRRGEMAIREKGHIIICNFPSEEKILSLQRELKAIPDCSDREFVLVADNITELPEKLQRAGFSFIQGSTSDETALYKANILQCHGVVILSEDPNNVRSDDRTFTTGSLIELISKEHNVNIKTIAELVLARSLRTMARTNVDGTISTDGISSCLLAQEFYHPGISNVINQMVTVTHGSQLYLHRTRLVGYPIVDLQKAVLTHEANIQIIGMHHKGEYLLNPDKHIKINEGDLLIILAENEHDIQGIEADLIND